MLHAQMNPRTVVYFHCSFATLKMFVEGVYESGVPRNQSSTATFLTVAGSQSFSLSGSCHCSVDITVS